MTRFNVNAGELLKTFAQSGESVAIIDRNGATYIAPDGPLDEIIIFGNRSLGVEEFGHLPDELLGRLKVGKRVSILLDDKSSSENPVSDFVRAYSLKFNGFVRIGNPTNDIESIARYTKVDGGESDKWPRAALYDGCIGNNAEEFLENWHAIQISKDILVLKPNQETTLPRADSFKKAQISTPEDNKGSNLYVLKNVFKSIDINNLTKEVFEINKASMRVLEKNGFYLEGVRRKAVFKNNVLMDDYIWVRLRPY
jgi:hypothetical protein